MNKEYGLNIDYIALSKGKLDETKSSFLKNCTVEELLYLTDNLNDLAKAGFILKNWDKIKIENIKL